MKFLDFIGLIGISGLGLASFYISQRKYSHTFVIDGQIMFRALSIVVIPLALLRGLNFFNVIGAESVVDYGGIVLIAFFVWVLWKFRRG